MEEEEALWQEEEEERDACMASSDAVELQREGLTGSNGLDGMHPVENDVVSLQPATCNLIDNDSGSVGAAGMRRKKKGETSLLKLERTS